MKTVLAMVLGSLFLAGSAMACPGEGAADKVTKSADKGTKSDSKKDTKTTT